MGKPGKVWAWVKQTKRFTGWWGRGGRWNAKHLFGVVSSSSSSLSAAGKMDASQRRVAVSSLRPNPARHPPLFKLCTPPQLRLQTRPQPGWQTGPVNGPCERRGNDWSANDRCSENSAARKGWRTERRGATVISVMKELKHCLSVPSLQLTSFLRANRRKIRES